MNLMHYNTEYTYLAVLELMRTHKRICGIPYGRMRHRIPMRVIAELNIKYRDLFKTSGKGKTWVNLNSAFRMR